MAVRVKTEVVRDKLIGQARQAFDEVAGAPHKNGVKVISKAEQAKLPEDLQKAVDQVRKDKRIVTVEDAVGAYAKSVSRALGKVDGDNGILSKKETEKIGDPALRGRVLDVRAQLLGGGGAVGGGPGSVNRGKLDANIESLQDEWGSANIMDGTVGIQSTVVAGDALRTVTRDFEALKGTEVDEFRGGRTTDTHKVTDADIKALAIALNDDGFQYAQRDGVPELQKQIKALLKDLGGPAGLDVAVAKQNALPSHIDFGTDHATTPGLPAQVWTFVNGKTNDAVSITVIKGTL